MPGSGSPRLAVVGPLLRRRRYAAIGKLAEIAEHLMRAGLRGAELVGELKDCARRDDLFYDAGSVNEALAIAEQRIKGAPAALVNR